MRVWYKLAEPATPISMGKSVGEADEGFIDVGNNYQEVDHEYYKIIDGVVTRKSQDEIDVLLAARAAAAQAEADRIAAKAQAMIDNLPTWQEVADAIDGVSTLAGLKVVVKKIARVVYWLAKDRAD